MFKSSSAPQLPTAWQYLKDQGKPEQDQKWMIDKILFKDEWKSITFFTPAFRYHVKYATEKEYQDAYKFLLKTLKKQVLSYVFYVASENEFDVVLRTAREDELDCVHKFNQKDYGWICEFRYEGETKVSPEAA